MDEKTIYKISVAVMFFGLIFLYFYSDEVDLKVIEKVDSAAIQEPIHLKGYVSKVSQKPKATFFKIEGSHIENTDVILFSEDEIFLEDGDYVELFGTVEVYNGKKEVIANKVIKK